VDTELVAFTEVFADLAHFVPGPNAVYLYGTTPEERSAHSSAWEASCSDVFFIRLVTHTRWTADFETPSGTASLQLRSAQSLADFWRLWPNRTIYIDITGLGHHVWAPLLRAATSVAADVRVVYVEPIDYSRSDAPTDGEIFDLSEKIGGIAPIPGFASLRTMPGEDFHLVVLLGFEGTRFAYLLENVQPPGGEVTPLIGAPGFKSQYPFYTYHGNKSPLLESRAWQTARYVTANCPFSAYRALDQISKSTSLPLKVAPIGTKPHSLGAVLYAIAGGAAVELVYDHPIRTAKRTRGASRALVYRVSALLGPPLNGT
jgi:hypothetical protein